jgi:hypothetical protein
LGLNLVVTLRSLFSSSFSIPYILKKSDLGGFFHAPD